MRATTGSVDRRDRLGQDRQALGGRRAGQVDVLLDREGHAVERPERLAGGHGRVGRCRTGAGLVGQHAHDGVQRAVHLVDARQVGFDDLGRRDLLAPDRRRQLECRPAPQLLAHRCPLRFRRIGHAPARSNDLNGG